MLHEVNGKFWIHTQSIFSATVLLPCAHLPTAVKIDRICCRRIQCLKVDIY